MSAREYEEDVLVCTPPPNFGWIPMICTMPGENERRLLQLLKKHPRKRRNDWQRKCARYEMEFVKCFVFTHGEPDAPQMYKVQKCTFSRSLKAIRRQWSHADGIGTLAVYKGRKKILVKGWNRNFGAI